MERREFIRTNLAAAGAGALALAGAQSLWASSEPEAMLQNEKGEYTLPPLPYAYNALEPYIDEQTMRLHHDKHHAGYVRGLNKALKALEEARRKGDFSQVDYWTRKVSFHGSGHFLHSIFWNNMSPEGGGKPGDALAAAIQRDFGDFSRFRAHFIAAAAGVEGSGWGALVYEPTGRRLLILQVEKHQNLTAWGVVPLLVVDVWEHAYYLKYQNRRKAYLEAFFHVISWKDVEKRLNRAVRMS